MVMANCKICVVTGTRAEYGLLRWVIDGIARSPVLELQLIATGMHLSPEFGLTVQEIEGDGHHIARKIEMLLSSDTPAGVTKAMGLGMIGFADALAQLQPDLLLVLGDRFEIFAAASAALIARIPIVHINGGELTEGAFDDSIRHSITKMAHIHFVSAAEYRNRVIQLGENPDRVILVGGLSNDAIKRLKLLAREELENSLDFKLGPRNLLITLHPVTLEENTSAHQMGELLAALDELEQTHFIFTLPNSDTNGRVLIQMIQEFCAIHPYAKAFSSLGQLRYLSCIANVDGVIGNSSSGLTEAPELGTPTVNIGDRQKGRICPPTVINCKPCRASISRAIRQMYSLTFASILQDHTSQVASSESPSSRIIDYLESLDYDNLRLKSFRDIATHVAPS
jgi:GDP/UDP-N,N'-diacetylbacillosamine 2-epimerase (hydrolysing)